MPSFLITFKKWFLVPKCFNSAFIPWTSVESHTWNYAKNVTCELHTEH
jgi:hypothetical protein